MISVDEYILLNYVFIIVIIIIHSEVQCIS